jgi:hypothetical protein
MSIRSGAGVTTGGGLAKDGQPGGRFHIHSQEP